MLMRASQLGISSKLLAMLGMGGAYSAKSNRVDDGEEALLKSKAKKDESGWD